MSGKTAVLAVSILVAGMLPSVPASADTFRVKATGSEDYGWNWMPATRHLATGDKVVWKNPTDKTHTVTAYGRGWSKNVTLAPGERTSQSFRKVGTFKYRCTVTGHASLNDGKCVGMCGKVRVH